MLLWVFDNVHWSTGVRSSSLFCGNAQRRPLRLVQTHKSRLIMQPHTLSRYAPEAWRMPDEAAVLEKVVKVITHLNEPWTFDYGATRTERSGWNEKAL